MAIIHQTETARRCQDYLEERLGDETETTSFQIWPNHSEVKVTSEDTFHKINQRLRNNNEITRVIEELGFNISIPYGDERAPENWGVFLDRELTETFLNKYGDQYEIG